MTWIDAEADPAARHPDPPAAAATVKVARRGSNRIDSLRTLARHGRVSLTWLVPGSVRLVRLNGAARRSADPGLPARFGRDGAQPRSRIVIAIAEVGCQGARALIRSRP